MKQSYKQYLFGSVYICVLVLLPQLFELLTSHTLIKTFLRVDFFPQNDLTTVIFIFKLTLLYVAFGTACFFHLSFFKIRWYIFGAFAFIYTYLYLLTYTPHLLASQLSFFWISLAQWMSPFVLHLFCALWIIAILLHRNGRALWVNAIALSPLAVFLFYINNPLISFQIQTPSKQFAATQTLPNVILIGVDSLRQDALATLKNSDKHPYTQKFLSESVHFQKVISDIGKTHPSLTSILSGQKPSVSNLRDNLQQNSHESATFLDHGILKKFKSQGYQTKLFLSDADFAFFQPTQTLDQVISPKAGIQNIIFPFYVTDLLLFGWQNNLIGKLFFPEIIDNNSFNEIWWSQNFTNRVLRDLSSFNQTGPSLSMYHSCQLHWPGITRYPSRDSRPPSPFISTPYGFENRYDNVRIGTTFKSDIDYNKHIYQEIVFQTANDYLEPIFKFLYDSNLISSSVVVLYSDHGEFLGNSQLMPVSKTPRHGTLLMAGDDSEYAVFNARFPSSQKPNIDPKKLINLSEILPLIAHQIDQKTERYLSRPVGSESSAWISKLFPGQMFYRNNIADDVLFSSSGLPYLDLQMENFLNKQRAVYAENGQRYTIFATRFGYQSWIENPQVEGDAFVVSRKQLLDMQKGFELTFHDDLQEQIIPSLTVPQDSEPTYHLDWNDSVEQLVQKETQGHLKNPWLIFIRSLQAVYRENRIADGVRGLSYLIQSEKFSAELKTISQVYLMRWELSFGFSSPEEREKLFSLNYQVGSSKSLIEHWHRMKLLLFQKYEHPEAKKFMMLVLQNFGQDFYSMKKYPFSLYNGLIAFDDPYRLNARINSWRKFMRSATYVAKPESDLDNFISSFIKLRSFQNVEFHSRRFLQMLEQQKGPLRGVKDPLYLHILFSRYPQVFKLQVLEHMGTDSLMDFETWALFEHQSEMSLIKQELGFQDINITYLMSLETTLSLDEKRDFLSKFFILLKIAQVPIATHFDQSLREKIDLNPFLAKMTNARLKQAVIKVMQAKKSNIKIFGEPDESDEN